MTLAEQMKTIVDFMRETVEDPILIESINDAIDSLWESMVTVVISDFLNGPATVSFAAASESVDVISIADPIAVPVVVGIVQGALAAHNVEVTYTLVTESGTETLQSPITNFAVLINNLLQFNSPTYAAGAIGWNAYAGVQGSNRRIRQNDFPIQFGINWIEPDTGMSQAPEGILPPTRNTTGDNVWMIKSIEVESNNLHTFWSETDVGSQLWKRFAQSQPTTSPLEQYCFDLIGGNRIQIQPAAGSALNPTYFYVQKPRRLRFTNSIIPFSNPGVSEFIKAYAMSLILLSSAEVVLSSTWLARAEMKRGTITKSLNTRNKNKNRTVRPFIRG